MGFYKECIQKVLEARRPKKQKFIEDKLTWHSHRISIDKRICLEYITKETLAILAETRLLRAETNPSGRFSF